MTSFDRILAFDVGRDGCGTVEIPPDWMQGRTAFGGLVAALAVRAMRQCIPSERELLALDVAFVAPLGPGKVEFATEELREGRYVSQAAAVVHFNGALATRIHGVFGTRRPSRLDLPPSPPVPSKPLEAGKRLPFLPGITPAFTRHFEFHFTEGDLPFSGSQQAVLGGYFRHTTAASGIEAIVALADAWPAPILAVASGPFPASSIRWSLHLVGSPPPDFDGYWWYRGQTEQASGGYATTVGRLYAGDQLVAWSEQLVAIFA